MTTALTAATNLLERVRDPLGLGLSIISPPSLVNGQAYAYTILSQAQNYINALEENQISIVPFSLTPYQVLYEIDNDPTLGSSGSSPIVKVIGVRVGDMDIPYSPFEQITSVDGKWFRSVDTLPRAWGRFGRDCWFSYPAQELILTVNLVVIPLIPVLSSGSALFTVTDDLIPQVMDLAEAIALFKLGEYERVVDPMNRLAKQYKLNTLMDAWKGGETQ